ncbi:hypothetical protein DFP72DRAFT_946048 [Ephemerocybe angulata]|uniref:Uncharacterized protein n=1 Tax=Ephemerocybe angulata TaxID=980116 RepID=A0A8H6H800_9AGAR|nr:hypothetical protein DFP72DRAFT_946048 [Tulosesus angulatus]
MVAEHLRLRSLTRVRLYMLFVHHLGSSASLCASTGARITFRDARAQRRIRRRHPLPDRWAWRRPRDGTAAARSTSFVRLKTSLLFQRLRKRLELLYHPTVLAPKQFFAGLTFESRRGI